MVTQLDAYFSVKSFIYVPMKLIAIVVVITDVITQIEYVSYKKLATLRDLFGIFSLGCLWSIATIMGLNFRYKRSDPSFNFLCLSINVPYVEGTKNRI